jgi:FdhD protein
MLLSRNIPQKRFVMLTRMKANNKVADEEKITMKRGILRVDLGKDTIEQVEDEVASETSLQLYIDNKPFTAFTCSPNKIKELVIGNLLTQGMISRPEEVKHLQIRKGKVKVRLQQETDVHSRIAEKAKKREATRDFVTSPETILNAVKVLDTKAVVFKRTGGTHAATLLDDKGEVLVSSEDIGRHNAVDKVIGEAALKRIDLRRVLLASTGRLSSEIVTKAAKVGVPVIVSLGPPTDRGVKVAERNGLTLIGFARDKRFNLYTHPGRLRKPAGSRKA